jgi:hypothetical protein
VLGLAALGLLAGCCRFWYADGGGPLAREELGDWAGMVAEPAPDAAALAAKVAELEAIPLPSFRPLRGKYAYTEGPHWLSTTIPDPWDFPFAPARGMVVKGSFPFWARAIPCTRRGHYLFYKPSDPTARAICAAEEQWGCGLFLGDFLWSHQRVDAYDAASGERLAAKATSCFLGWGLGPTRLCQVLPVGKDGSRGLQGLADSRTPLEAARYDLRDAHVALFGLIGWGRVNRRRYVQLLWIPIPVSTEACAGGLDGGTGRR